MLPLTKLTGIITPSAATAVFAVEVVSDEQVRFVALLVATVGGVIGVVAWLHSQIRGQISDHAAGDRQRHRALLSEIRHLRELLHVKLGLPQMAAEAEEED